MDAAEAIVAQAVGSHHVRDVVKRLEFVGVRCVHGAGHIGRSGGGAGVHCFVAVRRGRSRCFGHNTVHVLGNERVKRGAGFGQLTFRHNIEHVPEATNKKTNLFNCCQQLSTR